MQTNEAELIAQVITGDADAYSQIVDRYKSALYHHCYAILRDEDTAADVAQEAFIAAYYKINSFNQTKKFSTWLFKIATNKALDVLRGRKRFVPDGDEILQTVVSQQYGPAVLAEHDEVRRAVEKLEPRQRAIVSLYYWQGQSYEQIAETLGVPVGSVKGWMNRAKIALRKELL